MNFDIADICVRLNVGCKAYDKIIALRITKISKRIVNILYRQGIINSFFVRDDKILVVLKYIRSKPFIKNIKVMSTPGKRIYWKLPKLSKYYNANTLNSFFIISTPNGLLTSSECLLAKRTGGEIILKIELN